MPDLYEGIDHRAIDPEPNLTYRDLPTLKESRPRDSQTRRGKEYENWIRGSLQVFMLLLLPCSAPLSLKYLMVWLRV